MLVRSLCFKHEFTAVLKLLYCTPGNGSQIWNFTATFSLPDGSESTPLPIMNAPVLSPGGSIVYIAAGSNDSGKHQIFYILASATRTRYNRLAWRPVCLRDKQWLIIMESSTIATGITRQRCSRQATHISNNRFASNNFVLFQYFTTCLRYLLVQASFTWHRLQTMR
jgi:hypothetical protein